MIETTDTHLILNTTWTNLSSFVFKLQLGKDTGV